MLEGVLIVWERSKREHTTRVERDKTGGNQRG